MIKSVVSEQLLNWFYLFGSLPSGSTKIRFLIKPFNATDLFWYPLKISENQRFSNVFWGYQKRSVAWNELEKLLLQSDGKSILNRLIASFPLKLFEWLRFLLILFACIVRTEYFIILTLQLIIMEVY